MESHRDCAASFLAAILTVLAGSAESDSAQAGEHKVTPARRETRVGTAAEHRNVELFRAIQAGHVEVTLVPKNANRSTVLVKNKSNKPLRIKMPEAFVGVPVLAQVGDVGGGGLDRGRGGSDSSTNQSFGGGFGGGLGGRGGGGFFNVRPDTVRKIKVDTVCLEHGKRDPNPRVAYVLKPIESYTKVKTVIELCKMLGRGEIDQHAAQAVAWHLTDSLSWQQLATKVRIRHLTGSAELWFGHRDLIRAGQIVAELKRRVTDETNTRSPGDIEAEDPYGRFGSTISCI
jgi:hypothetical protein